MFIYFLTDKEWDNALSANNCNAFANSAKFTIQQSLRGDAEWTRWEAFEIERVTESQVWYAIAADCMGHTSYPTMPYIEVDIHMLTSGSEFSSEESGVVYMNILLFLIYVYFLFSTTVTVVRNAVNSDSVDSPTMGAILAIYMELLHIILQTIHLYIYSDNGQGFFILDMLSTVCEMQSQLTISGILVMIAHGWTITDVDLIKDTKQIVIAGIVILVHTLAAFLTAFDDDAHHKYHDYGGYQGLVIMTLRVGIYVVFIIGILNTIKTVPEKTKLFLKALGASGTLYMLAFPSLWVLSYIVPQNYRNQWIVFGNMTIQLFAIVIFLNQLSKKRSQFREATHKAKVLK